MWVGLSGTIPELVQIILKISLCHLVIMNLDKQKSHMEFLNGLFSGLSFALIMGCYNISYHTQMKYNST